jgi:glutamate racemase
MIGMFDSGSGGLTVLRAVRERVSSFDILYYGDIKNAPYGPKPRADIARYTVEALRFLHEQGARSIVSACNSVSASLAVSLFDAFPLGPDTLIEMVGPTVSAFKDSSARPVVFATQATVDAGLYQTGFAMIGKDVSAIAIPELAGAIERGDSSEILEHIVCDACESVDWHAYDVAVLACTHYPLVLEMFRRCIPPRVAIFDPAEAVAERVEDRFWPREAGNGTIRFFITQDSPTFRRLVSELFPDTEYQIEVIE